MEGKTKVEEEKDRVRRLRNWRRGLFNIDEGFKEKETGKTIQKNKRLPGRKDC